MPILPLDILHTIIDTLYLDDPNLSTTKSCSLVCRNLLPICRKRIFASFALNEFYVEATSPYVYMNNCTTRRFQQLLHATPRISEYICDLQWSITSADLENAGLHQCLQQITRLQSLTLWNQLKGNFQWNDERIRPALLHLIHLPSFIDLSLFAVQNFSFADLMPTLKRLRFSGLGICPFPPSVLPRSPIELEALSISGVDSATTQLCAASGIAIIDFTHLSGLFIDLYASDDLDNIRPLFSRCQSLHEVHITVMDIRLPLVGLSNMLGPSIQTLKTLEVGALLDEEEDRDDPYCGIADELEKLSFRNVIEVIEIQITIQVDAECPQQAAWGRLAEVLKQSAWPHLKRIVLLITVVSHAREDELSEELKGLGNTEFAEFMSRKSLSFKLEVCDQWV